MAFENVFGNIDFQAPTRARQAEAAQFQQLLGNAIQGFQEQKRYEDQMELKKAQIEAKQNQFNLGEGAEKALYKQKLGMELTPEDIAMIEAQAQIAPPVYGNDAFGNPIARPSGWGNVSVDRTQGIVPEVGASRIDHPPAVGGATMAMDGEFAPYDQINDDYAAPVNAPLQLLTTENLNSANVPFNPPQDIVSDDVYKAPAEFGAKGKMMEEKSKQKAQEQKVSGALKEKQEIEKAMRESKRPLFEPVENFTPTPADVKKMSDLTVSHKMLSGLVTDYKNAIKKMEGEGGEIAGTKKAQELERIGGKINMQVKNLEELGALQEPDIRAMKAMLGSAVVSFGDLTNPVGAFTQVKAGKKIASKSMDEFKSYIDNVLVNNAETRGFRLNESKFNFNNERPTPEQIRQELKSRRKNNGF